jgi:homocysteine S-methyltransferase
MEDNSASAKGGEDRLSRFWESHQPILTEGAVVERLRRLPGIVLDPQLVHAGFIYTSTCRPLLKGIYHQYLEIGAETTLPLLIFTPTWRANPERCCAAGYCCETLNRDAVQFMQEIREDAGIYSREVAIGGLIGCRGDAYSPRGALPAELARSWHTPQLEALVAGGVDFLFAASLPASSEAAGIAQAMASFPIPYLMSFIVRPDGCLLDRTPLEEIIRWIDDTVTPRPLGYLVNCVHHTVFRDAIHSMRLRAGESVRFPLGLQANTSAKSPEELEGSACLEIEDPSVFAEGMVQLHQTMRLKVLGGCCGTDDRHIRALGRQLSTARTKSS